MKGVIAFATTTYFLTHKITLRQVTATTFFSVNINVKKNRDSTKSSGAAFCPVEEKTSASLHQPVSLQCSI